MDRRQDRQPGLDKRSGPDPEWLAKRLAAVPELLRIRERYAAARGHVLFREGPRGREEVLDLTAGCGTLLFGHHPPFLREALADCLAGDPASAVSRSEQGRGEELEERLSALMAAHTKRRWTCTLASSPDEAVELALRHAELERRRRVTLIEADRKRNLVLVRRALKRGRAHMAPTFYRDVARCLNIPTVRSFDEACFELTRYAKECARTASTFVTLAGSYFGRSTGALAMSWDPRERAPYAQYGLESEFLHLDELDDLDSFVKRHLRVWYDIDMDEEGLIHVCSRPYVDVGAILVEPILYEGGVRPVPTRAMKALRALADKIGCPLVVDESRTGFGWTGRFLAADAAEVTADTYVLGAALGGGLTPLSALMIDEKRHVPWSIRTPPSIPVGDDPSCAVACRFLDELQAEQDGSFEPFRRAGDRLRALLEELAEKHPEVFEAPRGMGLILGLPLRSQLHSSSNGLRGLSQHALLGPAAAAFLLHECALRVLPCSGATNVLRFHGPPDLSEAEEGRIAEALKLLATRIERADCAGLLRQMIGLEGEPFSDEDWQRTPEPESSHPYARRVAFLGHFIKAEDMPLWDPSLASLPLDRRDDLGEVMARMLGPIALPSQNVRSQTGEIVTLHFIGMPLTSHNILEAFARRDTAWIVDRIFEGIEQAVLLGCTVVGFGGFTAVLTKNCRDVVDDRIATTSGISFTVVAGLEAIARACFALDIDPRSCRAGIAGASGDLSRNYAAVLAQTVPELLLVEAEGSETRLEGVAAELYFDAFKRIHHQGKQGLGGVAARIAETAAVNERLARPWPEQGAPPTLGPELRDALDAELGEEAPIRRSCRPEDLKDCAILVSGAPRGRLPITPELLSEGPVVCCDVALPASVDPEVARDRPRCLVLTGGLVRLPFNEDFRVPGIPLEAGSTFGCMAETMLLGLTGIMEDFSVGQLTQIKILKIKEIAAIHGFDLGSFKTIASM